MPLSDHYNGGRTEKMVVTIVTSDAETSRIEVVGRDAAVIQATPMGGTLVRWPKVGELWVVRRENGIWQLDSVIENRDALVTVSMLMAGKALIQATTIWTPSGERVLLTNAPELESLWDSIADLDGRVSALEP
jgi:hypothetical protein